MFRWACRAASRLPCETLSWQVLQRAQSTLEFPADCDDFSRISEALVELGITIDRNEPQCVRITGTGGLFRTGPVSLQAGLSGTAARFLIALALLRLRRNRDRRSASITSTTESTPGRGPIGTGSIGPFHEQWTLARLGSRCRKHTRPRSAWVTGRASTCLRPFSLLVGPLLPAGLEIVVEGELVSRPYIDVTSAGNAHDLASRLSEMAIANFAYIARLTTRLSFESKGMHPLLPTTRLATVHGGSVMKCHQPRKAQRPGRLSIPGDLREARRHSRT